MVAPKAPGHRVRELYTEGVGVPALVAVHQNATGQGAAERALAYALALGCLKAGVIETNFREETESDLFGEQAVLCGGAARADPRRFRDPGRSRLRSRDRLLRVPARAQADRRPDPGRRPQLHALLASRDTAEYGDYTRGPRIVNEQTRAEMKKILAEIQSGEFARTVDRREQDRPPQVPGHARSRPNQTRSKRRRRAPRHDAVPEKEEGSRRTR